jgi:multidrug resistance efflux pump
VSYPYPQDRHRDRREKGETEYREARQAMSGAEEAQAAAAEYAGEQRSGDEPSIADIEENLEEAAREVQRSIAEEDESRP